MKLRCRIKNEYLKDILEGIKTIEYRQWIKHQQIESIIFIDEQDREYEFEVKSVKTVDKDYGGEDVLKLLRKKYPDVPWDDDLPITAIRLGKRLR